jgi:hypothetical protein
LSKGGDLTFIERITETLPLILAFKASEHFSSLGFASSSGHLVCRVYNCNKVGVNHSSERGPHLISSACDFVCVLDLILTLKLKTLGLQMLLKKDARYEELQYETRRLRDERPQERS